MSIKILEDTVKIEFDISFKLLIIGEPSMKFIKTRCWEVLFDSNSC